MADRVGDQLIVPLPYGTQVDWVRNVLSSGEATIVGRGHLPRRLPELISSTQALPLLPHNCRRAFERVSIWPLPLRMNIAA